MLREILVPPHASVVTGSRMRLARLAKFKGEKLVLGEGDGRLRLSSNGLLEQCIYQATPPVGQRRQPRRAVSSSFDPIKGLEFIAPKIFPFHPSQGINETWIGVHLPTR